MTRTYWLSFVDPAKPEGERFIGACLVDVTDKDRRMIAAEVGFIGAENPDDVWVAAAVRKAHARKCNPGGAVGAADITKAPAELLQTYPRYKLMGKAEISALDAKVEQLTATIGGT